MKECRTCNEVKPYADFHRNSASKDGYKNQCRSCTSEYTADRAKYYIIKHRYGISKEQYNSMLEQQGNACAACRTPFGGKIRPEVDHDHTCCPTVKTCGRCIRGLLCHKCNTMAGGIEYNLQYLDEVLNYLAFHLNRMNGFIPQNISQDNHKLLAMEVK